MVKVMSTYIVTALRHHFGCNYQHCVCVWARYAIKIERLGQATTHTFQYFPLGTRGYRARGGGCICDFHATSTLRALGALMALCRGWIAPLNCHRTRHLKATTHKNCPSYIRSSLVIWCHCSTRATDFYSKFKIR